MRKYGYTIVFLIVVLGICNSVPAFEATRTDNVVVTATRSEMNPKEAPGAITIITREQIEKANARSLIDLLRSQTGVLLKGRSVGGRKTITFRGFNDKHTLMLVNGMRISASNAAIGHSDLENNWVSMENIERIEVVRGPLSALYGSEAMGGVINIITRKTRDRWGGSIQTKGSLRFDGNDGEAGHIGAQVSGPVIPGKLGIGLSAEHSDEAPTPDKDDNKESEIEGKEVTSGSVELMFTPGPDYNLKLFLNGTQEERENLSSSSSSKYYTDIYDVDKYLVGFDLGAKIGPTKNHLKAYRSSVEKNSKKTYESGSVSRSYDMVVNDVGDLQSNFMVLGTKMVVGGEVRKEKLESPTMVKNSDDALHKALFLQDEIVLFDRLSLTAGVRWDHHDAFGSETSPRIYALYKLTDQINLKAGYGHAFNAPTIKQVSADYHARTGPHEFFGNPDLKPETSDNFEAGVEYYHKRFSAKAFYFHNEIDNLIDWDLIGKVGSSRQFKAENIDEARIRGLETEVTIPLPYHFDISANYTYMDARDTKNDVRLEDKPRHTAGGALGYRYTPWDLWASLRWDYTGSQLVDEADAPAFSLWSFSLGKKLTNWLEMTLGIDNIGDIRLADKSDAFRYEERGRTIWAGLRATF